MPSKVVSSCSSPFCGTAIFHRVHLLTRWPLARLPRLEAVEKQALQRHLIDLDTCRSSGLF
jgi:hypothetical protein